jgi:hypothetical protein
MVRCATEAVTFYFLPHSAPQPVGTGTLTSQCHNIRGTFPPYRRYNSIAWHYTQLFGSEAPLCI